MSAAGGWGKVVPCGVRARKGQEKTRLQPGLLALGPESPPGAMDLNRIIQALKGTIDPKLRIAAETELNQVSSGPAFSSSSPFPASVLPPQPETRTPAELLEHLLGTRSFLGALVQPTWTAQRSYEALTMFFGCDFFSLARLTRGRGGKIH